MENNLAIEFTNEGILDAAAALKNSGSTISEILSGDLTSIFSKTRNIYTSAEAEELYRIFNNLKERFPEFERAINECSSYLSETVAPRYAAATAQAKQTIENLNL